MVKGRMRRSDRRVTAKMEAGSFDQCRASILGPVFGSLRETRARDARFFDRP